VAKSLEELLDALPGPVAPLDHIESRIDARIAAARMSDARRRGIVGLNLSVALVALVGGTAVGLLRAEHPPRPENNVSLVLTDIPRAALVD